MSHLRDAALRDRAGIEARHRRYFRINWYERGRPIGIAFILLAVFVLGAASLDVSWHRVFQGFWRLGDFVVLMLPPSPGSIGRALLYAKALAESVAIAFLGTILAALLALPFGFLAAKNVIPNVIVHFLARRTLDTIRAVDALIWALIWVSVVGLGPFAGVLAIACSDFGVFGKLFSEAIEVSDRKAAEGVVSTGGNAAHAVRYGLLPQVLPVLASQVLYYIESNTRSATIIGIVGAGGIGLYLAELIRVLEWQSVAFVVLMILVTVAVIDQLSSRLRFAIIGRTQAPA